jgi:YbbR domain-containing protein
MSNIDYEPQSIEIAAPDDVLNKIDELAITEDIGGASENIEKEVNLQDQLEPGIILVGDNQTAVVNISIAKPDRKEVAILPSDIRVRNISSTSKLEYLTTGPVTLKLAGPKKEIDKISKDDIIPYIDLANYSLGTYSVAVKADLAGYTIVENTPTISIRLISQ